MDGAGIKPFKFKERDGTCVHRLTLPDGNFFLKRYPGPSWRKIIKCFALGRRPATMASDEYRAAKLLQSKNIPILNAVAWGERRVLGIWPTANFILSEEVKGADVTSMVHQRSDGLMRLKLLKASAALAAKMHAENLFFPFRPNDLLCLNPQADTGRDYQLVIIDPDVKGKPLKPKAFSEAAACEALSYSAYMMLRCRIQLLGRDEYRAFMRAYKKMLKINKIQLSSHFGKLFRRHLNRLLTRHYEDPFLVKTFPYVPAHVLAPLAAVSFDVSTEPLTELN